MFIWNTGVCITIEQSLSKTKKNPELKKYPSLKL